MNRNLERPNEWRDYPFNELIWVVRETVQKRFYDTKKEFMIYVGSSFPNGDKFVDFKLLLSLATTFRVDTEALKPQLETCKLMLMHMTDLENTEVEVMCSIFDFYHFILLHKDSLYCLYALVYIACTLPISTASCERSFSCLRRIKTWLCASMGHSRLSYCGVLAMSKYRRKRLESEEGLDRLVKRFAGLGKRSFNIEL